MVAGKMVSGKMVAGKMVSGKIVAGKLAILVRRIVICRKQLAHCKGAWPAKTSGTTEICQFAVKSLPTSDLPKDIEIADLPKASAQLTANR